MSCNTRTTRAAANPTPERMLSSPSCGSVSSSSSTLNDGIEADEVTPSGAVGGWSFTVAFGSVGAPPGGLSGTVGVAGFIGPDGARRIVGAGAVDAPAGRSGIVGAGVVFAPAGRSGIVGAGALDAPAGRSGIVGAGAVGAPVGRSGIVGAGPGGRGAPPGTGGRFGGASGTVEDGTAGASAAFKVTRTVSFFSGTLDVCLDGVGGWFSFSLMRAKGFSFEAAESKTSQPKAVKRGFPHFFDALLSAA